MKKFFRRIIEEYAKDLTIGDLEVLKNQLYWKRNREDKELS